MNQRHTGLTYSTANWPGLPGPKGPPMNRVGFAEPKCYAKQEMNSDVNKILPTIGGVIGSVVGAYFGGPMGAMIGNQAGQQGGTDLAGVIKGEKNPFEVLLIPPDMRQG